MNEQITLVEGLKKAKALLIEANDLRKQIALHCADMTNETPVYGEEQSKQISSWLQAHEDKIALSEKLRLRVAYTNATSFVSMKIGDKTVRKSIAAWVLRKQTLAAESLAAWEVLGDRGLKNKVLATSSGTTQEVTGRRYFDPVLRDRRVREYRDEPGIIDRTLEHYNAVTFLKELPGEQEAPIEQHTPQPSA